jgi:hypothetical protein
MPDPRSRHARDETVRGDSSATWRCEVRIAWKDDETNAGEGGIFSMDPGQVVWLPGSGYDQQYENWACEMTYGGSYYACDSEDFGYTTEVACCF